ncbi:MAG: 4-alpha-glucanotransferase [Acidobacteria bacterium RIFCSPLOWO2_12_FULL_67_14b]|nr:MAG: 4-alpha-glucanotransferase [Acidobacteria bacterium RIFCSPLOWO2_12_FULL_67_14b]
MRRQSGLSVPLFSLGSSRGWGIGEFPDLAIFSRWAAEAGQALLQILPVNEMPPAETSPYSAMTAMALDPIYISMVDVVDFAGLGGELALDEADAAALAMVRKSPRIRYQQVRHLKQRWLRRSFDRFLRVEVARGTPRALRFDAFVAHEAWWLDEYGVFRALHALHEELPWQDWPEPLAKAEPATVQQARVALHLEITYRKYLQWLAAEQWAEAKRLAWPTRLFGDLPFMISADSPDVWARQDQFRFDATIGVPPDAFSETGQDWGLPPWRWEAMASTDYAWMRARARRYAHLYDGFRIDHLVGLYRMYIRPIDTNVAAFFAPPDEPAQIALGEQLIGVLGSGEPRPMLIAEDLGVIPPFVRESMARLDLPGSKVLRWERHWDQPGQPPIDPREFPERSVATTGTHDIEPLASTPEGETEEQRATVVRSLLAAGSCLTLIPLQDVFGWTERINTPALVNEINWTWRLPWPIETWLDREDTIARADLLRAWTREADR